MTFHTILAILSPPHASIYPRIKLTLTYPSYHLNATAKSALYENYAEHNTDVLGLNSNWSTP